MVDVAELGFKVDQRREIKRGEKDLDSLTGATGRAEKASLSLGRTIGRMAGTIGTVLAAAFSISTISAYQDGLAEVSTLVDTTTFSMSALSDAALDQTRAFGNLQGQVGAYYQIISAGAGSVAEATDILTASNRLAIGGVTTITTAADGLTSVLNAYGDKVESATAVSDAFFVGVKAGKTTVDELAGSLGKVAPLAAQTNVAFDELIAAVAALTKGGISTNEAITGVRAVLAAIAKPTAEASELAKKLGLEFNATALETKGLTGFLDELVEKTGGSTDVLALLFGGVEALIPVMALSGQAGVDFNAIMEDMANKAGATEEAFNKMAMSPGFQSQRLMSGLTAEAIELTGAMGDKLVPAIALAADNVDLLAPALAGLAGTVTVVYLPAIIAGTSATVAFTASLVTNPFFLAAAAAGVLAGGLVYLAQQERNAEAAANAHSEALASNAGAIETAKSASQGFRNELQGQITTQIAAAQAAVTEAKAQYEAAKVKAQAADAFGGTMSALSRALFGEGRDPNYGADILDDALSGIDEAEQRVRDLQMQLFRLGEVSSMNAPANDNGEDSPIKKISLEALEASEAIDLIPDATKSAGYALDDLGGIGQRVVSTLASGFTNLVTGVLRGTTSIQDAVANIASSLGSLFLNNAFQMILGGFLGGGGLFGGSSYVPGFGAYGAFAEGTNNAPPGMAWVGERGPELVKFRGGEEVIPHRQSVNMMTAANSNSTHSSLDVRVSADREGLYAYVRDVSGEEADQRIDRFDRFSLPRRVNDMKYDTIVKVG